MPVSDVVQPTSYLSDSGKGLCVKHGNRYVVYEFVDKGHRLEWHSVAHMEDIGQGPQKALELVATERVICAIYGPKHEPMVTFHDPGVCS